MASLSEILRSRLIPRARQGAADHFIVARTEMKERDMPVGVRLDRHELTGKRVVVKNQRNYSNVRSIVAEWPTEGLHEINNHLLVCVVEGFIDYRIGNYNLQCGPGHFIFIPPGLPRPNGSHSYVDLRRGTHCELISFLLHHDAVECWTSLGHAQGRDQGNYCLIPGERAIMLLRALMEETLEEDEDTKPRTRMISEGLLIAFLNVVDREVEANRIQYVRMKHSPIVAGRDFPEKDFATRLDHYVNTNLRKDLSLERVSRDMYLSPSQFTRRVRAETGDSFNEFVSRRRLEEAKTLLRNSPWTVSTIAGLIGFSSAAYFCTFFKARVGESPGDYRAGATPPAGQERVEE